MRIGNLEDMEKTEESGNLAELIMSDHEENLTKPEKYKNWWYYHKWYVIAGIIILGVAIHLTGTFLGLWTKDPDFQIAYIGKYTLPQDTVSALEQGFAAIAEDFNGDGEIIVQINQYSYIGQNTDSAFSLYEYGDEVPLIGDISSCESFFFLTDDPENLQQRMQILSNIDGSIPDAQDYSAEGKVIAWADCPILNEMELGEFDASYGLGEEEIIDNQELLSEFYIGRRLFYNDKVSDNYEECCELWEKICNSR